MFLQDLLDFFADIGVGNEQGDTPMQADIRERPGEQSPRRFRLLESRDSGFRVLSFGFSLESRV